MSELPWLERGAAVTVGSFDGVHRGHLAVIEELVRQARAADRAAVVVTFEPHPVSVLRPDAGLERLTTGRERLGAMAETPIDYLVVLRFDRNLASLDAETFVRRVLIERYGMRELVVGHDHGLGRNRSGDLDALRAIGTRLGFPVHPVEPVTSPVGGTVSSTAIRRAIAAGDFAAAAAGLGRPYRLTGVVEAGVQRGRTIGVPTANVAPPAGKLLPPDGVYAVRVEWGGGVAGGMMNQGLRPTIGDGRRWLEVNLFDFEGDLYGREIRIEWVAALRPIRRFESLDALRDQLAVDRAQARSALGQR